MPGPVKGRHFTLLVDEDSRSRSRDLVLVDKLELVHPDFYQIIMLQHALLRALTVHLRTVGAL
jgi:hypothetical protein